MCSTLPTIETIDEMGEKLPLVPHNGKRAGISCFVAMVFVVGEMAGSGVLAMPYAISSTGYAGFVLMVIFGVIAGGTGVLLGKSWDILQERYDEYNQHTRAPFASIGFRAYGKPGKMVVSITNDFTMFGAGVVFIILASQLIQSLLSHLNVDFTVCLWMALVAAFLTPLTWLGTPKDMWPVAIIATLSTAIACVIITVNIILIEPKIPKEQKKPIEVLPFMMAFGTLAFTFAGTPAFPTIQHDMKEPKKFGRSLIAAFTVLLAIYSPVAYSAYFILGDRVKDNILIDLNEFYPGPMVYTVQILIVVHLIFAFVIVTNPLYQEIEDALGIPLRINWKRVALRTAMVASILFVAETIPRFGVVLSLLGGSAISVQIFVFPTLFYMKLCSQTQGMITNTDRPWPVRSICQPLRVLLWSVLLVGILCGICATYAAIDAIVAPNSFVLPCYVNSNITSI
ncbi:uncharacterized protein LOC141909270 isoform X2 [Tubulanus polymorphus]|uniref:uncharacterized protein LOC141909270 isoform X2 n=1 Tax=Tubulanus polymorphus TaxID=672921 RepID=UPI003DA348F4